VLEIPRIFGNERLHLHSRTFLRPSARPSLSISFECLLIVQPSCVTSDRPLPSSSPSASHGRCTQRLHEVPLHLRGCGVFVPSLVSPLLDPLVPLPHSRNNFFLWCSRESEFLPRFISKDRAEGSSGWFAPDKNLIGFFSPPEFDPVMFFFFSLTS